ncbi:MAG: hypothetical protein RBT45_02480 [Acholeplasmataceae bacterium]|nr:hypothetical protein [Acholeplasmataceae bacterium]
MKKLFTFFFAVLVALSLFACEDGEQTDPTVVPTEPTVVTTEGTGYGLVHGHYVGMIDVTVGADGNVTDATVEEYFLPYSWAKVDVARTATGYGLVHGHYVGMIDITINAAGNVTDANVEEYFLPYSAAKVDVARTAVGYGLVHGHYVGMIEVSINAAGNVTDAVVEEYFLPYSAAKVVVADPENIPADVVSVTGSRGTSYYAKYFSVDGILFTGTVNGEAPAQTITYAANDIADIEVWVEDAVNAKHYVDAVEAGTVFIANENGTESDYVMADASASVSMKKSESPYWSGPNYPLGWAGNAEAFETAITGTKMNAALETIVKNAETGFWSIGDIVTGATMTDFKDYYEVAQRGYQSALTVVPEGTLSVTGSRGTSLYSEYVMVDGILFTGTVNGEAPAQTITYAADGIADIEVWVEDAVNAKRYVDAVDANLVFNSDASGTKLDWPLADASAKNSMKKSLSGYWSGANYPLGWAGNVAAFETAITGTKLNADLATIVKNAETGYWSIGDVVTGATWSDFKDYYEVSQRGYQNALTVVPEGTLSVTGSRGTSLYSQYIMVDGMLFTGTVNGTGNAQTITYAATGIADIEAWVEVEANAKRYVEAVDANLVFVSNASGTKLDWPCADASAKVSMKKSLSGYWSGANYPLGWAGNVNEFIEAITGTKLDATLTSIVKNAETGFWSIGTIVTGATWTDFVDYYEVAQRAYNNAE